MAWLVFILGVVLAVAGAVAIFAGAPIIEIERGWSEVIAGTVALSGGVVTIALGCVLARLMLLQRTLVAARPAATGPAPVAAKAASPAIPPPFETPVSIAAVPQPEPAPIADLRAPEPARELPDETHGPDEPAPRPAPSTERPKRAWWRAGAKGGTTSGTARASWAIRPEPPAEARLDDGHGETAPAPPPDTPSAEEAGASAVRDEHPEPPPQPPRQETDAPAHTDAESPPASAVAPGDPRPRPDGRDRPASSVDWLEQALSKLDERFELGGSKRSRAKPVDAPNPPDGAAAGRPSQDALSSLEKHLAKRPNEADVPATPGPAPTASQPGIAGRYNAGGVVYVMFTDGSIEADTANGRYRFHSLAELKSFIEQGNAGKAQSQGG